MKPAFFFDFDGTIAETRYDIAETVNHTRRDLHLTPLPIETIVSFIGHGATYLLSQTIPEYPNVKPLFMSHYDEHALDTVTLYPGVKETLQTLHSQGYPLGIVTAKPPKATHLILRHFALDTIFGEAIIAGGDSKEMKPSPLPLYDCAKRLHHPLTPHDLMVGDNHTDIACGTNAQIQTAFCTYGFGTLQTTHPTYTITTFPALLTLK